MIKYGRDQLHLSVLERCPLRGSDCIYGLGLLRTEVEKKTKENETKRNESEKRKEKGKEQKEIEKEKNKKRKRKKEKEKEKKKEKESEKQTKRIKEKKEKNERKRNATKRNKTKRCPKQSESPNQLTNKIPFLHKRSIHHFRFQFIKLIEYRVKDKQLKHMLRTLFTRILSLQSPIII